MHPDLYIETDDRSLFPELTGDELRNKRPIAFGTRIRKLNSLIIRYGGDEDCWEKLSTRNSFRDETNTDECFEIHYYRCKHSHDIGIVGLKRKPAQCPPDEVL